MNRHDIGHSKVDGHAFIFITQMGALKGGTCNFFITWNFKFIYKDLFGKKSADTVFMMIKNEGNFVKLKMHKNGNAYAEIL